MQCIAIFGGTFDPIHNGHLQTSVTIQNYFNFNHYLFLPCKIPAIKPAALANNQQRIHMIELALKDHTDFSLDLREIERDTPSYMVETLESFRLEYPKASITLVIGYDAFISLPRWHQWQKIISLANLLVINRDEFAQQELPEVMHEFLQKHQVTEKELIKTNRCGQVYLFDAGNYPISSTAAREALKRKKDVQDILPNEVYNYIKLQELYQ